MDVSTQTFAPPKLYTSQKSSSLYRYTVYTNTAYPDQSISMQFYVWNFCQLCPVFTVFSTVLAKSSFCRVKNPTMLNVNVMCYLCSSSESSEPVYLTKCFRQTDRSSLGQGLSVGLRCWHHHWHSHDHHHYLLCRGRCQEAVRVLHQWPVLCPQGEAVLCHLRPETISLLWHQHRLLLL